MENCFRSHLGVPRITKILLTAVDNVCSTLPHLFDVTLSNHTNSIGYIRVHTTYTCVLHSGWRAFWMMMMHLRATCLQCRFSCMETIQQAYIPPLSPNYFSKGHVFLNTKDSRSGRKTGSRSAKLIVCGYPEGVISLFFHVCKDIVHCPKAMNVEGKNWIRSWPAKYLDLEVTESGIQLSRFLEISTSWSHYPYRRTIGFFQ